MSRGLLGKKILKGIADHLPDIKQLNRDILSYDPSWFRSGFHLIAPFPSHPSVCMMLFICLLMPVMRFMKYWHTGLGI